MVKERARWIGYAGLILALAYFFGGLFLRLITDAETAVFGGRTTATVEQIDLSEPEARYLLSFHWKGRTERAETPYLAAGTAPGAEVGITVNSRDPRIVIADGSGSARAWDYADIAGAGTILVVFSIAFVWWGRRGQPRKEWWDRKWLRAPRPARAGYTRAERESGIR